MSLLPLSPDLASLVQVIRYHGRSTAQVRQLESVVRTMGRDSAVGSPEWPQTLAAIRARHVAATHGPWGWFGYLRTREEQTTRSLLLTASGDAYADAYEREHPEVSRG